MQDAFIGQFLSQESFLDIIDNDIHQ